MCYLHSGYKRRPIQTLADRLTQQTGSEERAARRGGSLCQGGLNQTSHKV